MNNILILNAHKHYPFAEGKLTQSLIERMAAQLERPGRSIKVIHVEQGYDVNEQLELHKWADLILVQSPVNWMGVPWVFKKYVDEVYTAGMGGDLCAGDGRSEDQPTSGYGTGGTLQGKKYMLSLTFNAPEEAFNNDNEWFFQGRSVDDLFYPQHMNFRFFGMEPLPTFVCYDVMKNPQVEHDFLRLDEHLKVHVPAVDLVEA